MGVTLPIVIALIALLIPLGILARLVACAFSLQSRQRMKSRPMLHVLWAVAGLMIVGIFVFGLTLSPCSYGKSPSAALVSAVSSAITAYLTDYARYPLQTSTNDHTYIDDQAALVSVIFGLDSASNENPRRLVYLDVLQINLGRDGSLRDAWGNTLNIRADWSMDGLVRVGTNVLARPVAVWSNGKNGKNEFGSGDDITSWR